MSYLLLFTMLLFWHFIADYPLQGDFLSKAKAKASTRSVRPRVRRGRSTSSRRIRAR